MKRKKEQYTPWAASVVVVCIDGLEVYAATMRQSGGVGINEFLGRISTRGKQGKEKEQWKSEQKNTESNEEINALTQNFETTETCSFALSRWRREYDRDGRGAAERNEAGEKEDRITYYDFETFPPPQTQLPCSNGPFLVENAKIAYACLR
ncbi:hypothetical protein K438DRAFT_1776394 [Mycena galopus ATCC 62051]|nr:hypothetical protein K438DRAFT_1776394 [Mycena galopus ATCC 62051]